MAERRMFAKSIVLSDAFLDMPLSARCLYFTLGMLADDDGFVGNPKSIMRQCGASNDDMVVLLQKRFLLSFDDGVVVIKHWRINNYLRSDRYTETNYQEDKQLLGVKENGSYQLKSEGGIPVGIPVVDQSVDRRYTQDSIGKDRVNKVIEKEKPVRHKYGMFQNVLLSDDEMEKLKEKFPTDYDMRINKLSMYIDSKGNKYKNHYSTLLNWDRMDKEREAEKSKAQKQKDSAGSFETDEFIKAALARS